MSQNLRVATFVPIADPAVGNLIKATAIATANKRVPSAFAADDNSGGSGGGGTPSNAAPIMNGTAAPGVGTDYSRADHVHPSDTSRAATSHTHTAANVTDFSEAVDDRVGALLVAGSNIGLSYNDAGNALTINNTMSAPPAATPGGSTTQVQFNDAGAFAGDAGMVFDKATDTLTVAGQIKSAKGFSPSAPNIVVSGTDGFTSSGGNIFVASGGVSKWLFDGTNGMVSAGLTGSFGWTPGAVDAVGPDTAISRNAAGVVEVNNGTAGTLRDLKCRYLVATAIGTMQGGTNIDYSVTGLYLSTVGKVSWNNDVVLQRSAAGVLEINDGAVTPALRDLKLRHLIADGNIQIGKGIGFPTQQYLYFDDGIAAVSFKTGGYQTIGIGPAAGTPRIVMGTTLGNGSDGGFACANQGMFASANNASDAFTAPDTNISRSAAGVVQVGTTARNALGTIKAATGIFGSVNVATAMGLYDSGSAQVMQFAASSCIFRTDATGHITVQTPGFNVSSFQADGNFACMQAAYKPGGGAWADSSDQRIKSVYGDYDRGLAEVCALRPVTFSFLGNDGTEPPAQVFDLTKATAVPYENSPHYHVAVDQKKYAGLIAQEVELVMPEMITRRDGYIDGQPVSDLRDLDTTPLIFAMINAIKQLKADNEALQIRLDALEATPGR